MTRFVGNIRVEFLDPAQRSDVVYRGLETALSAKDSRRFQRVMLVSPGRSCTVATCLAAPIHWDWAISARCSSAMAMTYGC